MRRFSPILFILALAACPTADLVNLEDSGAVEDATDSSGDKDESGVGDLEETGDPSQEDIDTSGADPADTVEPSLDTSAEASDDPQEDRDGQVHDGSGEIDGPADSETGVDGAADAAGDAVDDAAGDADAADDAAGDAVDDADWDAAVIRICSSDRDCREPNSVCRLIGLYDGPLTAQCREPSGAGGAGFPCSANTDCESRFCFFETMCVTPCQRSGDCPVEDQECADFQFVVDDGDTPETTEDDVIDEWEICLPTDSGSLAPCANEAECSVVGETCGFLLDTENGAIERRCLPAVGEVLDGECVTNGNCKTGRCLDTEGGQFCYWACADNDDCGDDMLCGTVGFEADDGEPLEVPACVPTPDSCGSSVDCVEGESCWIYDHPDEPNTLDTMCITATGELQSGATCVSGSECASGQCYDYGVEGRRCLGVCNFEEQLGCAADTRCYVNIISVTFDQETPEDAGDDRYDSFSSCLPDFGSYAVCVTDEQCPLDETCGVFASRNREEFQFRCVDRVGAGIGGEPCDNDSECRSEQCISDTLCFGLCDPDAAPTATCYPGTLCGGYEWVVNDRGTPDEEDDDIREFVPFCAY